MKYRLILLSIICSIFLTSCFQEQHFDNSKKGNLEALWTLMDQQYCFFEYKNIDWKLVYDRYAPLVNESISNDSLFNVMAAMLSELRDGHVNLVASHDKARYWAWSENYPDNFDIKIQRNYIGTDYAIAGGLIYKILDDNVGYIYYDSFSSGIGDGNISQVFHRLSGCAGIIFDIRNNGGGALINSERLVSHLIEKKTLIGYIRHKTGLGHNDFSEPYPRYIEPSLGYKYLKKLVVLTNRSCYSAANDFASSMQARPNTVIIGDHTGGGGGMPMSSELPNGWYVRYSASPMYNAKMEQIEFGIDPDIQVSMTEADMAKGLDTIIETARAVVKER